MRNRFLIFIAAICASFYGYAQDVPQLIPPSPDQAAINKFGEIPVNYSSGLIGIDVPLYTITTKNGLSIPIGLSYHAGGIRVDDIASSVGLGWSLNIGNSISATVRGVPDLATSGMVYDGNTSSNVLPSPSEFDPQNDNDSYQYAYFASNNIEDSHFDIFHLNFAGRSVKFAIDESRKAHTIPFQPIRIDVLNNAGDDYFKVYDETGNQFIFDVEETSKVSNDCSTKFNLSDQIFNNYPQTWYLSKIITTDGEEIDFYYTEYTNSYELSVSESKSLRPSSSSSQLCPTTAITTCITEMHILKGRQLNKITFNRGMGEVVFTNTTGRNDQGLYKTTEIKVKQNGSTIRDYSLTYDHFEGTNTGVTTDDRLKLVSVEEQLSDQIWAFDYEESVDLPERLSFQQDYWGYFNGKSNSTLIPSYSSSEATFSGADRSVDINEAKAYSLKKITYPTGGYSEFTYESNSYYGAHFITGTVGNHDVGGLRIKQIKSTADAISPVIIKNITYLDTAVQILWPAQMELQCSIPM